MRKQGLPELFGFHLRCNASLEMEHVLVEENPVNRCYKAILVCLELLEEALGDAGGHNLPERFPQWDSLFGPKESVLSVLNRLVAMQKTVLELQSRTAEMEEAEETGPMSDADWELLGLCVDRWRERQAANAT